MRGLQERGALLEERIDALDGGEPFDLEHYRVSRRHVTHQAPGQMHRTDVGYLKFTFISRNFRLKKKIG